MVAPELAPTQDLARGEVSGASRIEFSTPRSGKSADAPGVSVSTIANRVERNRQDDNVAVKRSPDTMISIPFAEKQVSTDSDTAVWGTNSPNTSLYIREVANGVQFLTVLGGPDSAHEFEYDVDVPAGTTVRKTSSGLAVSAADGTRLGHFATPWVRDATGASVPVEYTWNDGGVLQKIDTSTSAPPHTRWLRSPDGDTPSRTMPTPRSNKLGRSC